VKWLLWGSWATEHRTQPLSCVDEHTVLQYSPFAQGLAAGAEVQGTQMLGKLSDW
jgi:hypothetical protein